MNAIDIILIIIVAVILTAAIISIVRKKGKSCCGDCEKCRGQAPDCKKN